MTMKTAALLSIDVQLTLYAKQVSTQRRDWIAVLLPDLHVTLDKVFEILLILCFVPYMSHVCLHVFNTVLKLKRVY